MRTARLSERAKDTLQRHYQNEIVEAHEHISFLQTDDAGFDEEHQYTMIQKGSLVALWRN
jgi:hypothetical protein